jgi:superfamily II DNA/RNA helicase
MKLIGIFGTAVLSLTLGVAIPAYTQDKQEEEKAKPAQEEKKAKPAKQDQKNAQQQDKNKQQEEKSAQQQNKNNQQEQRSAQQQDRNNKQEEKNAQRSQPAQRAGGGSRIPDDRYRANFGREHSFHVSHNDYDRDRRFQYGGYWFTFVDVWPGNWEYTQDVFVVEIDGMYYLCNPMYPGVNVAINVTL